MKVPFMETIVQYIYFNNLVNDLFQASNSAKEMSITLGLGLYCYSSDCVAMRAHKSLEAQDKGLLSNRTKAR